MITIICIECGASKEVTPGRGRTRYTCSDKCRLRVYRKEKGSDRFAERYRKARSIIDQQYKEARRTSVTPNALRSKAICALYSVDWAVGNIAKLFGVTEQRIRTIVGKELKADE